MWLKRSHLVSGLGAPLSPTETYNLPGWIIVIAIMLMIALPILAVSIVVIVALERLVLSRINTVAVWLGLRQRT
jgi:uncharacterized iron-regulated membrane protein